MIFLKSIFFFVLTAVILGWPFFLIGFLVAGFLGVGIALGLVFSFLLLLLFQTETLVAWSFPVRDRVPHGMDVLLERSQKNVQRPASIRVRVFVDPHPKVLVARSFGGKGTLFFSQGALSDLSEKGMEEVLAYANERVRQKGLVASSFFALLAQWVWVLVPRRARIFCEGKVSDSRRSSHRLTPIAALWTLLLFPFYKLFCHFSRAIQKPTKKVNNELFCLLSEVHLRKEESAWRSLVVASW